MFPKSRRREGSEWCQTLGLARVSLAPFSFLRSRIFSITPPLPLYPPTVPSEQITRWHGVEMGCGFAAQAFATALADLGCPIAIAISL